MPGCSYSLLEYDQAVSDIKQYFESKTFDDYFYRYISTKELKGALPSVAALSKSARQAVLSQLLEEGFYRSDRGLVMR